MADADRVVDRFAHTSRLVDNQGRWAGHVIEQTSLVCPNAQVVECVQQFGAQCLPPQQVPSEVEAVPPLT